ncbi:hypothetical protein [Pseudocolwellia sp. HL-MZ7]|uniref:hypothetical protein n=1 Tax=Pseudocolwellia sp. HL-MZ7 TaxID=3400627 RepID=UPI003CFA4F41
MKKSSVLFFLILFNSHTAFAAHSLICNIENFTIPNVDISKELRQEGKRAAANFMLDDSYWSFSFYELDKMENTYLLKDIEDLEEPQSINEQFLKNYSYRLNEEVIFDNVVLETSPIMLSDLNGLEFVLIANFIKLHPDINKNEEIFVVRVATKAHKIYFSELHVNHVTQMESTIQKAKKMIDRFSDVCSIK